MMSKSEVSRQFRLRFPVATLDVSSVVTILDCQYTVFDCDGVVLRSNAIKTDAFRYALRKEPKALVERLVAYHKANGGITRHAKFVYYFQNIKGITDGVDQAVDQAAQAFAEYCRNNLCQAELVPGIEHFLSQLGVPCYLVTGGDQEEVRDVLTARGIARYFDEILGGPVSKKKNMDLLRDKKLFEGQGIYFGDSKLDYELSQQFNQSFVFISDESEWLEGEAFCRSKGVVVLKDFEGASSVEVGHGKE